AVLSRLAEAAASLHSFPVSIPTSHGALHLLYHHNAELGGVLRVAPKPSPPRFQDFEDYRDYLVKVLGGGQAKSKGRFLATISSGYDSVACASLIAAFAGADAITFGAARGGRSDSGAAAARTLGLNVTERERPGAGDPRASALFLCAGLGGE